MRLSFEQIQSEIERVFIKYGMTPEKAKICSRIHTESTNDGIYSHGVNRVTRFVEYVRKGWVDVNAEPSLEKEFGAVRVYNGNLGPGILNALYACDQAMELANQHGIGLVGLKNTTHWMRGGTYGLYAARKGYVAIMWTNTEAVMPPWGGKECRLGNNPFVLAMPGSAGGAPFLLDMAVSQYSYGKLQVTRLAGEKLPYPGGFDENGVLTDDPGAIEKTRRVLPVGYWKGSGLSFMLDLLGAVLTDGAAAVDLNAAARGSCGGCSQVMILIDPQNTTTEEYMAELARRCVEYVKSAEVAEHSTGIRVPGEGQARFHRDHECSGIYVDDSVWAEIQAL